MIDGEAFRASLTLVLAAIRNNARQALAVAVKTAEQSAQATSLYNDGTGYLRQHTKGESFGLEGKLVADAKYAVFVEAGTVPHAITAKRGGTLSFVANGERIFRKTVQHPGTKPRPFMQEARDLGEKTLEYGLEIMIDAATKVR